MAEFDYVPVEIRGLLAEEAYEESMGNPVCLLTPDQEAQHANARYWERVDRANAIFDNKGVNLGNLNAAELASYAAVQGVIYSGEVPNDVKQLAKAVKGESVPSFDYWVIKDEVRNGAARDMQFALESAKLGMLHSADMSQIIAEPIDFKVAHARKDEMLQRARPISRW